MRIRCGTSSEGKARGNYPESYQKLSTKEVGPWGGVVTKGEAGRGRGVGSGAPTAEVVSVEQAKERLE